MKLSIITPVFNGESHISDALESLLSQDFRDWEAVIVDDGSTDATAAVVESFVHRDNRIRLVRQKNGGVSSARNRGMDSARGEWIAWLDADDSYVPSALKAIASSADGHPDCSCLQFPYFEKTPDGRLELQGSPAYALCGGREYGGTEAFEILFSRIGTRGQNWQPWRFVYRRDSLPRFRQGRIHEDVDVLPLHLYGLPKVFISKEPFYAYVPAREGAATASFSPRRVEDIIEVTRHVYEEISAAKLPEDAAQSFKGMLAFNLFGYYLSIPRFGEPDKSRLFARLEERRDWLLAIDEPKKSAWLKRLLMRILGIRKAAALMSLKRRP